MILTFIIAVLIIAGDQLLKFLVVNTLKTGDPVTVLGGLVKFLYCENKGMAFGMLQNQRWIFIVFTLIVLVAVVAYMFKAKPKSKFLLVTLGFILGGGIGNLIDRIFLGYVVDYIQLSFFSPICNFADYCITAGTVMLVIYILFFTQANEAKRIKRAE